MSDMHEKWRLVLLSDIYYDTLGTSYYCKHDDNILQLFASVMSFAGAAAAIPGEAAGFGACILKGLPPDALSCQRHAEQLNQGFL